MKINLIIDKFTLDIHEQYIVINSILPLDKISELYGLDAPEIKFFVNSIDNIKHIENIEFTEHQIKIPNEIIYMQDENGDFIIDPFALKLPKVTNLGLTIADKFGIGSPNFQFEFELKQAGHTFSGNTIGAFYYYSGNVYLLPEYIYRAVSLLKEHSEMKSRTSEDNWRYLSQLKKLVSNHDDIQFTKFLNNQDVVYYDEAISVDSVIDAANNIHVKPRFLGLTEELNQNLVSQLNQFNNIQNVYTAKSANGKSKRIIIDRKLHKTLQKIHDKPKISTNHDKTVFLDNPNKIYQSGRMISLENFSERVIGFGILDKEQDDRDASGLDWVYPVNLSFVNTNNCNVDKSISNKDELDSFKDAIIQQKAINSDYFIINENICPFNSSNLSKLAKILPIVDEIIPEVIEFMVLKNIAGNDVKLNAAFNKTVAKDVNKLLKESKGILDDLFYTISNDFLIDCTEDIAIPLNRSNLATIFKKMRHGLFLDNPEYDLIKETLVSQEVLPDSPRLPTSLNCKLLPHQLIGVNWLQHCYHLNTLKYNYSGILLADDMGLGKTLQVLTFLEELRQTCINLKPILIVAPVVLLYNWKAEYKKFFGVEPFVLHGNSKDSLSYSDHMGVELKNISLSEDEIITNLDINKLQRHKIIITNYHTLVNYQISLSAIDWSIIVLDEAQNIKNPTTLTSKVAKALKSEFKIAISGTPVENSLKDLWSIFDFLNPRVLPPLQQFKDRFNDKSMTHELFAEIKQFFYYEKPYSYIMRRLKSEILDDLPSKSNENIEVDYVKEQYETYNDLKLQMANDPTKVLQLLSEINILHQSFGLYQNRVGFDYDYFAEFSNSPKGIKLLNILTDIQQCGEKVLIFATFIKVQELLQLFIEKNFGIKPSILNGTIAASSRTSLVNDFEQSTKDFAMILSPKSAGVGLNIVCANHVIHYGRWWNPAIENQATDRVYRIGQKKDVKVYFLTHTDNINLNFPIKSFDELLNDLLVTKNNLAGDFLTPTHCDYMTELSQAVKLVNENS